MREETFHSGEDGADSIWDIPGRKSTSMKKDRTARVIPPGYLLENAIGSFEKGQRVLDRFEIVELIGRGGMSLVYRAFDAVRDEPVALKFLSPALLQEQTGVDQFLKEARISSQLNHPNILHVFDAHSYQGVYFLSMELLEGKNLRQIMHDRSKADVPFSLKEVMDILRSLVAALTHAHQKMVHRDIKPENIGVSSANHTVCLMDFGLARLMEKREGTEFRDTLSQLQVGTPYYMAPEQLRSRSSQDHRVDQFAVAVVAYELLTGELPLGLANPLSDRRRDLPVPFCRAIDKALSTRPEDRFEDIAAFGEELELGYAKSESVLYSLQQRFLRSRPIRWIAGIGFVFVLLLLLIGQWNDRARAHRGQIESLYNEYRTAEKQAGFVSQLYSEKKALLLELRKELRLENFAWEKGLTNEAQFGLLLGLSNKLEIVEASWSSLEASLTATGEPLDLKHRLGSSRDALEQGNLSRFQASMEGLRQAIRQQTNLLNQVEFAFKNRHTALALNRSAKRLAPDSLPALESIDSNIKRAGELMNMRMWETANPLWLACADELFQFLEPSYERALKEVGRQRERWEAFFGDARPPDLRFLVDTGRKVKLAARLKSAHDYAGAVRELNEASETYRSWIDEVEALHDRHAPVWESAQGHKVENRFGMRFIKIGDYYWSVWETRVMDFAKFIDEKGVGWEGAGDFWKTPGYPQGPVSPVVGIDLATARAFAKWLILSAPELDKAQSDLPSAEQWLAAADDEELAIGVYPDFYEWNTNHYMDEYYDPRLEPGQYIRPVGLGEPNAYGLYDMNGNVWEWSFELYDKEGETLPNQGKYAWMLLGGGTYGEVSYHGFSPPNENTRFVLLKQAIGFRVVFQLDLLGKGDDVMLRMPYLAD